MLHRTISNLMAGLACSDDDAAIGAATDRLDALKRSTSGDERACCCWVLSERRGLLTAGGRRRRAATSAARRSTIWVGRVA